MPSGRRLAFTREALDDLDDTIQYSLESWGSDQADRYAGLIDDAASSLLEFPELGRRTRHRQGSVRQLPVAEHLILYTYDDERVLVLRIVNGRRNLSKL